MSSRGRVAVTFGIPGAAIGLATGLANGADLWTAAWTVAGFLCTAAPGYALARFWSSRSSLLSASAVGACIMALGLLIAMLGVTVLEAATGGPFFAERPGDVIMLGAQFFLYLSVPAMIVAPVVLAVGAATGAWLHH